MHNTLTRIQNTFGFFTSCAFAVAAIIAVLSVIPIPAPSSSPTAAISVRNIQVVKGRPHYYSTKREEYAHIRFDLDADLSSLFTWNTKQLFVYVKASYPASSASGATGEGEVSEAVIWDTIIPAPTSPYSVQSLKAKYFAGKTKGKTGAKAGRKGSKTTTTSNSNSKDLVKPGLLALKNQKGKYQITDPSGLMGGRANATLVVGWNVQPWVGALVWENGVLGNRVGVWSGAARGRSPAFDFPPLKGAKAATAAATSDAVESPQTPVVAGEATPVVAV